MSAIDVADLEPHDLARPHPAAIGEREHDLGFQARSHGQDTLDLLLAQHQRHLHRLLEVKDLGHQIVPPQGHAEQKLDPGHGLVARADACPALDQMLLEMLHIIRRRRLWRAPEPGRKPLAGAQVAGLGCRAEIARCHIGNHARTQGRHWCRLLNVHRNVLCQSRQNHLDQQHTPNITNRATNPSSAQRPPQAPLSRSDLVLVRFTNLGDIAFEGEHGGISVLKQLVRTDRYSSASPI